MKWSLFLFLLLIPFAQASIERIVPETVIAGETFTEIITVTEEGKMFEMIPAGITLVSKEYAKQMNMEGLVIDYIERDLVPGTYTYTFIAQYPGEYFLDKLQFNSEIIKAVKLTVLCNQNNLCEDGESYSNCVDCKSGIEDSYCDMVSDNICDPDCAYGDPDCLSFCGDNTCDEAKESCRICPEDCGKLKDEYSGKYFSILVDFNLNIAKVSVDSGRVQYPEEDGTLLIVLNDVNGKKINSFWKHYSNLEKSTFKVPYSGIAEEILIYFDGQKITDISITDLTEYCGDGICSNDEIFCSADCNVNDTICDISLDGVCDKDCLIEADPDCKRVHFGWAYLIIPVVIFLIILWVKKKN